MKLSKMALVAAIACGTYAGNAFADQTNDIKLVSHCAAVCDCGEPVCGCEPVEACDSDCCNDGCCDSGCDSCCDSGCGLGSCLGDCGLGSCLGDCCHDDPYTLFGDCGPYSAGGWMQLGYFNKPNSLFNTFADNLQLQQAWLWAERSIDTSCGFDIGGRIDALYGTDAQNTQAFGTDPVGWDNPWDNGVYGWAMPQLYLEAGYGDLSVKAGHFYTIIGYEVVQATGNFFYSHAYTFNNSEPFTHTGILATYNMSDDVTLYGGWTEGWDSGFDDNGDNFLGGISVNLTDDFTVIYATTIGRFASARYNGNVQGYMSSLVANWNINDNWEYVFQSDVLDTDDGAGTPVADTFDINQYLFYTFNDCWQAGGRFEWYQNEGIYTNIGQQADIYALTLGVNYSPNANLTFRPEVRWDWVDNNAAVLAGTPGGILGGGADSQTTFAIDGIFTF